MTSWAGRRLIITAIEKSKMLASVGLTRQETNYQLLAYILNWTK